MPFAAAADSRDRERRARLARRGQRRELKLLAGTRRGRVLDAPRALELPRDAGVDRAQLPARAGPAVGAARGAGERLQRSGVEPRALDRHHVDGHARLARDRDRVLERRGASGLVAIGDRDQHATGIGLVAERPGRLHEAVVESRALLRVDREARQRGLRVGGRGREPGQEHRRGRERGRGHAVVSLLRPQESLRGGDRVAEGLALHRLRAVDREDDALGAAEVLREQRVDGPAVLEQLRGLRGRRGRHDACADRGVCARVDALQLDAGARRAGEEEGRSERRTDDRVAPHAKFR